MRANNPLLQRGGNHHTSDCAPQTPRRKPAAKLRRSSPAIKKAMTSQLDSTGELPLFELLV